MIVTDDEKLATRLRTLRNHGQTGDYLSTERGWNSVSTSCKLQSCV